MDAVEFERLYKRYVGKVYQAVYRVVGNCSVTEDLVQEAFVNVYLRRDSLQNPGRFYPYVRRAALNLACNYLRRNRTCLSLEPVADELMEEGGRVSLEDREALSQAWEEVPQVEREVLDLLYYQGLTRQQAARCLKVTQATVGNRLRRGLDYLRQSFRQQTLPTVLNEG